MAVAGQLKEIGLPTLIQLIAHEGATAQVELRQENHQGRLYLEQGTLHHAELHTPQGMLNGEAAVYALLEWHTGQFSIERDIPSPQRTIHTDWNHLLIEGLRRLDEQTTLTEITTIETHPTAEDDLMSMLDELSHSETAIVKEIMAQQKEKGIMASKSEQLRTILSNIVNNSADIQGAVIVDNDGLLLASALNSSLDGNRVAAVSAGLVSLSSRSAQQLGQGEVQQTLIQAKNGNVIAIRAGAQASFVALTGTGVNLGMAFLECREAAQAVAEAF